MTWILMGLWSVGCVAVGLPLAQLSLRQEKRLSVLLCCALVGGHCLQVVLLILLWGFMPLGQALYVVLGVSMSAAAALVWRSRNSSHSASLSWGMSRLDTCVVAALAAASGFLAHRVFTVAFSGWDAEAMWWHSSLVGLLGRSLFPPFSPLEPSDPLQYRFGLHALGAAVFSAGGGLPPEVLAAVMAALLPMLPLSLAGASVRITGSPRPGSIAALLSFFGGSLLPYYNLSRAIDGSNSSLTRSDMVQGLLWHGNTLDMLHINPSIAAGTVAFAIALWLTWEGLVIDRATVAAGLLSCAALAYLGLVNEVHFAILSAGLVGFVLLRSAGGWYRRKSEWWQPVPRTLLALCLAYGVIALRGGILGGASPFGGETASIRLLLNSQHAGSVVSPPEGILEGPVTWYPLLAKRVLLDTDLVLIGLAVLLFLAYRTRHSFAGIGLLAATASLILWASIYPEQSPSDAYRFGQAGLTLYLTMAPFVVTAMRKSRSILALAVVRWLSAIVVALLIVPHLALALWLAFSPPQPVWAMQGTPDVEASAFLQQSTTTRRVFIPLDRMDDNWTRLYRPDGPPAAMREILGLSGHAVPTGHQAWNHPGDYLPYYRRASVTFDQASLAALSIDWVYVLPAYLHTEQRSNLQAAVDRGELEFVRSFGRPGDNSERRLYRLK
jgi:hypothetical protein